jgi:DnaJ-class molecular chaperone
MKNETCRTCKGTGEIHDAAYRDDATGARFDLMLMCPHCNGTGKEPKEARNDES